MPIRIPLDDPDFLAKAADVLGTGGGHYLPAARVLTRERDLCSAGPKTFGYGIDFVSHCGELVRSVRA